MPITKQAIKRVKQDRTRYERNRHYSSHMKSMIKLILEYAQKGESEKALKILPEVTRAIDTCAKKNIIHKRNAARKKSRIQKAVSNAPEKAKTETSEKKKPAKKAAKKPVAKKAEKKPAKKAK